MMTQVYFEGRLLQFPTQLSECTPRQVRRLLALDAAALAPQARLWAILLALLTGAERRWLARWVWLNYHWKPLVGRFRFVHVTVKWLPEEKVNDLLEIAERLRTDARPLVRPPHRWVWVWLWRWLPLPLRAPGELLLNLTFRQYRQCEKALCRPAIGKLAHVPVVLHTYRPLLPVPQRALRAAIERLPADVLDGAALFYAGSRKALVKEHKYLFPKKSTTAEASDTPPRLPSPREVEADYARLRRSLAGNVMHEEPVDLLPLWDVVGFADYEARKAHEHEEAIKAARRKA